MLKSGEGRTYGQHVWRQWSIPAVTMGCLSGSKVCKNWFLGGFLALHGFIRGFDKAIFRKSWKVYEKTHENHQKTYFPPKNVQTFSNLQEIDVYHGIQTFYDVFNNSRIRRITGISLKFVGLVEIKNKISVFFTVFLLLFLRHKLSQDSQENTTRLRGWHCHNHFYILSQIIIQIN